MFAKALKGQDIEELISTISSAPVGVAAPVAGGEQAQAAAAPKKEEKKEEEAADVDMGGLFGDEEY